MRIINDLDEMTETARGWLSGGTVGFVPMKGNLHAGHLKLVQAARQECEICVVSIFRNPLELSTGSQQGTTTGSTGEMPPSPDLAHDLQLLSAEQVDVVFAPRIRDFYPAGFSTFVTFAASTSYGQPGLAQKIAEILAELAEGLTLSDYLRGFATGITKLVQLVRPDILFFSQKDALQITVIRKLVRDLNIDIRLGILPTFRESDGLAVSLRNGELAPDERQAATVLYRALLAGKALIESGERLCSEIEKAMADVVAGEALVAPEYITLCNATTFQAVEQAAPGTLLLIAAHVGKTYLVDTIRWRRDGQWLT
jgi:pantoate--beta-alanine ligase